jgi:hypothetical protein
MKEFPAQVLREYALLADGERGVLVGPRGEFCWMCALRWDSDAIFAALIGGAGIYAVTPRERFVWGGAYEPGSLIWRSRWVTTGGIIECREALAFPSEPGRAVLLRRIIAQDGDARVHVVCDPRPGFGAHRPKFRGGWEADAGGLWLRWTGADRAWPSGRRALTALLANLGQIEQPRNRTCRRRGHSSSSRSRYVTRDVLSLCRARSPRREPYPPPRPLVRPP